MTDFKVGDKVFGVLCGGVYELIYDDDDYEQFLAGGYVVLKDGRNHSAHKYPRFISLEAARAKGYDVPVQKVKKSRTFTIKFDPKTGSNYLADEWLPNGLNCYLTKEVTFEWEEEV